MPSFLRPHLFALEGYAPGEQPRGGGVIKLNTNENPYPPSPKVFEAIQRQLTGDALRKYPDPTGLAFREAAGRILGVDPDSILIGNGSDELLTLLVRACVPEGGMLAAPTPSYLLYRTLAELHGARCQPLPFDDGWRLSPWKLDPQVALTFIPNPNSPSGTQLPPASLADWPTPLVLDEAYADFAAAHGLGLIAGNERLIVTRSFSKSYALAGIRFGFAVAQPQVIRQLQKLKDSYNCDVLSQAAATAAIEDQAWLTETKGKILATRARMERELAALGFFVTPSQANFVWCRRNDRPLRPLAEALRARGILVRFMTYAGCGEGLRISVGTDAEIDRLLDELRGLLAA